MCILLSSIENKISLYRNCLVPLLRHRTCPPALSSCLPALSSCLLALSSCSHPGCPWAASQTQWHQRVPLLCHRVLSSLSFFSVIIPLLCYRAPLPSGIVSPCFVIVCPSRTLSGSSGHRQLGQLKCQSRQSLLCHRVSPPAYGHRVPLSAPAEWMNEWINFILRG